uniref:histidine kinase n=1 Tax=Candidatus Desulfatibia profunda TaxID=2841695 RepID=A0A8J6NTZ5_9BACT|nr:methyl-accepting chemotaxis protein [Candidatus Desulfatibia profunda]
MTDKKTYRRRNYFIDKKYQTAFAFKFLIVLIIAASVSLVLFTYYTRGTVTIGYNGLEINLDNTNNFFLPVLSVWVTLLILATSIVAAVVMIFISHKIAGPLFHIKQALAEVAKGNLTTRVHLRKKDQCKSLADAINEVTTTLDGTIGNIKTQSAEISCLIDEMLATAASNPPLHQEIEHPLQELRKKITELQDATNHLKTSHSA